MCFSQLCTASNFSTTDSHSYVNLYSSGLLSYYVSIFCIPTICGFFFEISILSKFCPQNSSKCIYTICSGTETAVIPVLWFPNLCKSLLHWWGKALMTCKLKEDRFILYDGFIYRSAGSEAKRQHGRIWWKKTVQKWQSGSKVTKEDLETRTQFFGLSPQ